LATDFSANQLDAIIQVNKPPHHTDTSEWMCANRLKLNRDKTRFIWLGTPRLLPKLQLQTIDYA